MSEDVPQSHDELVAHLDEQLAFMRSSADAYDQGFEAEAKRLALSLRVLFHSTRRSRGLLEQLQRLDGLFLSTTFPYDERNISTHAGLVMISRDTPRGKYVPHLDGAPYRRQLTFDDWWNEPIIVDDRRVKIGRSELVLSVADKDGGAHVDPALNNVYHRLSRENSMGWVTTQGQSSSPIRAVELASIRQVAHETLKTLVPGYGKDAPPNKEALFGGVMVFDSVPPEWTRVGRNEPCPCGSGKKFKKCHGAPAT